MRIISILFPVAMLSVFNWVNSGKPHQSLANSCIKNRETRNSNNVDFLKMKNGAKVIPIKNSERGGDFRLIYNVKLKDDYAVVFPATIKGRNWHWVRQIKGSNAVNIKWYGAEGKGISSYKSDSAALHKAIAYLSSVNGGKLYIPASDSFYGFNGDGILLPDNIEIYGDGPKSEIKHINPESATYYKGAIFYTTTYGPVNAISIMNNPTYPINDAEKSQDYIVVKNVSDAANLEVGKLIGLGAGYFIKNQNDENRARYAYFEINEITKIEGDTIYIKYPLSVPLLSKFNSPGNGSNHCAEIIDVNGNHSFNKKMNVFNRISKNIYIHDLKLSQSDYNMILNQPYKSNKAPDDVIALGGTFESKFQNLVLDGFGTFGGNLFNRCEISNLKVYSVRKLTDLGYGSANTVMHDIEWQYKTNEIANMHTVGFVYLNDGTHDIEMYNIKAFGNWKGNNLFVINGGGKNILIHDVNISLPEFVNQSGVAIIIKDDNQTTFSQNIQFKNITISVGLLNRFVQINGTAQVPDNRQIVFDNVEFNGRLVKNAASAKAISIINSPGIILKRVKISEGDIILDNAATAKIESLNAPQSNIINRNGRGNKPEVTASTFNKITNN